MTAGLLYSCQWHTNRWSEKNKSWTHGWELLLFIGVETIHRDDGVVINNYRFHDVLENQTVLLDIGLTKYCKEIKGDSHECN
jgi:hypothetical protein